MHVFQHSKIDRHLAKIFETGKQTIPTNYYNLDAIISVGCRVYGIYVIFVMYYIFIFFYCFGNASFPIPFVRPDFLSQFSIRCMIG